MTAIETAPTQAQMGLSSITSVLTSISQELGLVKDVFVVSQSNDVSNNKGFKKSYSYYQNKNFSIIKSIRDSVEGMYNTLVGQIGNVTPFTETADDVVVEALNGKSKNTLYGMIATIRDSAVSIGDYLLDNIIDVPEEIPTGKVKPERKAKPEKGKMTTESFYSECIRLMNELLGKFKEKKSVNFFSGNFTKTSESKDSKGGPNVLKSFGDSIKMMSDSMTPKFMKTLERFKVSLEKILTFDPDKFKPFIEQFGKFSKSVSEFADELQPLSKTLMALSGALFVFGLAGANPMIYLGIAAVGVMGRTFSKHFSNKQMPANLFEFAKAIGILSAAMIAMNFVNFSSVLMMVTFVTTLGFALRSYRKMEMPMLLTFSYAIGVLTLAMLAMNYVSWGSAIMMIGFIWGLGKVLNGKTFGLRGGVGAELVKFSMGLGILTLAMFAFAELPIQAPLMMLGFIAGLLLVLRTMNKGVGPVTPLGSFAMGIGILVLAMFAIDELPWTAMFKMIVFIVGVCMAIRLAGGKGQFSGMAGFGFGMGILVLAAYGIGELEWGTMAKFVVFLLGVALAVKLMGDGAKSKMSMLGIAAGILGVSAGMYIWKKAGVEWGDVFMLLATIGGLGLASALLGTMGVPALIGAGVMIALAASVIVFAVGLEMISNLSIDWGKMGMFGLGCLALAGIMALITPLALLGVIGAALMIPISISASLAAVAMMAISALTFDNGKIDSFTYAVGEIAWCFMKNILWITLGAVGAVLFVPIAAVSLLSAGVLALISAVPIDNKKIDVFIDAIGKLIDGINNYGLITLGKVGLKSLMILPLMAVGMQMSEMMLNISNSKVTATDMEKFTNVVVTYIDKMTKVINDSVSKIEDCTPGIEAIAGLTGIAATLADTIQKMINMEIVEHTEKDGKLVVKSVKKFDFSETNLNMIGVNIANMVKAIADPISALGTSDDDIKICGIRISNPFSKKNKGMEFIHKLGESITPLVDSVATFAGLEISKDPKMFENFKTSMIGTIGVIGDVFKHLSTLDPKTADSAIQSINAYIAVFSQYSIDSLTKFNEQITLSLSSLSDDVKWNKINKNLDLVRAKFYDISKAIKSIDIAKATAFENNLKLLVDKNNSAELTESVNSLAELLGMVQQHQEQIQTSFADRLGIPDPAKEEKKVTDKNADGTKKSADQMLQELLTQLNEYMGKIATNTLGTTTALGKTLKVEAVGVGSNRI